jgi:hypothetical protein
VQPRNPLGGPTTKREILEVICVRSWPITFEGGASAAGISQQETDGYHLARWTDGDLSYCAISDLNAAELRAFAEAFRNH